MRDARTQRFAADVMVADVCGFSALSEEVARGGPGATERLSDAINAVFSPIVDLVQAHGGEVALFVGDAVVAVFPRGGAARACAAAVHGTGGPALPPPGGRGAPRGPRGGPPPPRGRP